MHGCTVAAVEVKHGRDATQPYCHLSVLSLVLHLHRTHPSSFSLILVHSRVARRSPESAAEAVEVRELAADEPAFPSKRSSHHELPRASAVDPPLRRAFPSPLGEVPTVTVPPARRRRQFLVAAVAFDRGPLDPDPTATYRFAVVKPLTVWPHPSVFYSFPRTH